MYLYVSTTGSLIARAINFIIVRIRCCRKKSTSIRRKQQSTRLSIGSQQQQQHQQQPRRVRLLTPTMKEKLQRQSQESPLNGRRSTWQTKGSGSIVVANGLNSGLNTAEDSLFAKPRPSSLWPGLVASVLLLLLYVLFGAILLTDADSPNGWAFGEAFYFCFVSLFTVGFGGLRPEDENLWSCVAYIFIGLAVLSTCFFILRHESDDETTRPLLLRRRSRRRPQATSATATTSASSSSSTLALNARTKKEAGQQ